MKKITLAGLILAAATVPAIAQETDADVQNKFPGYKLEFNQDFEESYNLTDVWNFEYGFKRNSEHQCYMDPEHWNAEHPNAYIKDGNLVIEAHNKAFNKEIGLQNPFYSKYASTSEFNGQKREKYCYTSASMQSHARYHYGIWETRAKLPIGTGYWPAIWGTGNTKGWPSAGELDIMEYYGDALHANVAWGADWQHVSWNSKAPKMAQFGGGAEYAKYYHIWRCEWNHNTLRIYMDDILLNSINLDQTVNPDGYNPYRDPENTFQVWLNLALGGMNGGNPDSASYPAQYLIDYTRVYIPESAAAALIYTVSKAEALLEKTTEGDGPMEYTTENRQALTDAINEAKGKYDLTEDADIDAALDALESAMDTYEKSINTGINEGETFSLRHKASQCVLTTAVVNNQECVIVHNEGEPGVNQQFILKATPEGAASNGYNLMTGDGKYVYRTSWNLYVKENPTQANLKHNDYIFNIEVTEGNLVIKNMGSGKYFGTDNNSAGEHLYSDKGGQGNPNAYFEFMETTGIEDVIESEDSKAVTAIYNLQGMPVNATLQDLANDGVREVYIVVRGSKSEKVVL